MLFRDRPLLADGIDADRYVDRIAQSQLRSAALAERNTLVVGRAGTGKTSLLHWLRAELRRSSRACTFVDGALASDVASLTDLVDDGLENAFPERPARAMTVPRKSGSSLPRAVAAQYQVRRLADEPVVILLDNLLDTDLAYEWFGRLRDEVWALGHTWIVTARPNDATALRTPPANAFWSTTVELGPLIEEERSSFLSAGLEPDDLTVLRGVEIPQSVTPRELIRYLLNALAHPETAGELSAWERWRRKRAAQLGPSEQLALAELESIGRPVSAHDDELLGRLDWSRAYLQRILARLADEGLVHVVAERTGNLGRPRKLYEPAPHPVEGP
jgi:hypothetical protein